MNQRKVVVTGLGQVSPAGNTVKEAWDTLIKGHSCIGSITRFDASDLPCRIAGEIRHFDIEQYISAKEARRMGEFIHFGIVASLQAIADAKLDEMPNLDKTRVGVNIGSGIGGLRLIEENSIEILKNGPKRVGPFFIPGALINLIAGHVSILKGYQGPTYAIVSAEKNSRYGHPHAEVLARVEAVGVEVLSTAEVGTIIFKSDGKRVWVEE